MSDDLRPRSLKQQGVTPRLPALMWTQDVTECKQTKWPPSSAVTYSSALCFGWELVKTENTVWTQRTTDWFHALRRLISWNSGFKTCDILTEIKRDRQETQCCGLILFQWSFTPHMFGPKPKIQVWNPPGANQTISRFLHCTLTLTLLFLIFYFILF